MQVIRRDNSVFEDVPKPEWLSIIFEIGFDEIGTATSFVEYFCDVYGESRSSVWYRLKRLKEMGLLSFAEKGEEPKPLALTPKGKELFRQNMSRMASMRSMERQSMA